LFDTLKSLLPFLKKKAVTHRQSESAGLAEGRRIEIPEHLIYHLEPPNIKESLPAFSRSARRFSLADECLETPGRPLRDLKAQIRFFSPAIRIRPP